MSAIITVVIATIQANKYANLNMDKRVLICRIYTPRFRIKNIAFKNT